MTALTRNCILTLAVGMAFGFCSAYFLFSMTNWSPWDVVSCDRCNEFAGNGTVEGDVALANELSQRVRVLCWVMTQPAGRNRCESIKRTWGKRCNIILFMSSEEDPKLPAVRLDVEEGRLFLWAKTKQAFQYVYENYLDEADWFMKADDDTYVVVDNLRNMLQAHNPDTPVYFGRKFTKYVEKGYMSGGAGYVLSREALKRFVEVGLPDPEKCQQNNGDNEDLEMGKCLGNAGVIAGSSSDCLGRGRFFPLELESHLEPGRLQPNNWFWEWADSPSFERMNSKCLMLIFLLTSFIIAAAGSRDFSKRHAIAKRQTTSLFDFDFSFANILNTFLKYITIIIKTALKVAINSALTALPVIG